jgi:hypothetical protein
MRKRPATRRSRAVQDNPAQLTFFTEWTTLPLGDGTLKMVPTARKPVAELTPEQFARAVGRLNRPFSTSSVYRWIADGRIRRDEWRRAGARKIFIAGSAVERFRDTAEE